MIVHLLRGCFETLSPRCCFSIPCTSLTGCCFPAPALWIYRKCQQYFFLQLAFMGLSFKIVVSKVFHYIHQAWLSIIAVHTQGWKSEVFSSNLEAPQ